MIREIEKKFVVSQLILLGFFAWGVGFLYVVSTVLFNSVQLHWEIFCFLWEALAFGLPLIIFRPMMRPIQRYARQLEAGAHLTPEQVANFQRKVLAYPFKVGLVVFFASLFAYVLGVAQVRYFARLPWESVIITLVCGVASGLLWAVLEYFLLEYYLRPLTGLTPGLHDRLPLRLPRVSLKLKIFASSLALVVASLVFFGIVAYTRAVRTLEQEIGVQLTGRMRELANLIGALPAPADGGLSVAWRVIAAEFPISPKGYFCIVDGAGNVMAIHPDSGEVVLHRLQDADLLPGVIAKVLTEPEGYVSDRVDHSKILSFVDIPGHPWKIVAIAPLKDFSPQLDQLVYSGLTGMAFALVLTLGIGFLCARSITTSLAEVTRTAQAVAEKRDLRQRVTFLTNDEVGVLAHAFNEMAEGLQTYAEELEERVAERTKELAQRGEQLESKNTELSDFLYVASHDLRSPLINLAGFSRALQDSVRSLDELMERARASGNGHGNEMLAAQWPPVKEDITESLDFILRSVAKMDVLVKALLDLSRIETRHQVHQPIETNTLVHDIFGTFNFQLAERKIAVHAGDLPVVFGDPVRINQVFSNLIDNAIKYMPPEGEAKIEVGCEAVDGFHRFFVRDTGRGIRPEDRDKVFRLFTRLGGNGAAGDGVGLAAVKKIIEKHGGRIWVESTVGVGSTFLFTLPQQYDAAPASDAAPSADANRADLS